MTDTGHYHVMAVQDWGGSLEYWVGWDDKLTLAEAEQLARDAIEADREVWGSAVRRPGYHDELEAKFKPKYGDGWTGLYSTNVAPGWSALFILPSGSGGGLAGCQQDGECDIRLYGRAGEHLDPWWTHDGGEVLPPQHVAALKS